MWSDNQSSVLVRDAEVDYQAFEEDRDDRQVGDAIKNTRPRMKSVRVHAADDLAEQDGRSAFAATGPPELVALKADLQKKDAYHGILSKSPLMHSVFDLINDLGNAKATVLIEGDTGTGKEQVARAIHATATNRRGAFVAINCAALSEALLESELFGHEKGAFTSAVGQRRGRFEIAQGGTILLDEVGDMPASMQVKLLRVLQERTFERVGGAEAIQLDVQVIGATNRSLQRLVKQGKFREDLFYRLNVVKINLPPLCHRPEDIPLLTAHFIEKHGRPGEAPMQITAAALDVLLHYSWPGNIRELENAIERACVISRNRVIDVKDLPDEINIAGTPAWPFLVDLRKPLTNQVHEAVAQVEMQYLRKALRKTNGHIGKCARMCGLSRRCVTLKIAKYQLNRFASKAD